MIRIIRGAGRQAQLIGTIGLFKRDNLPQYVKAHYTWPRLRIVFSHERQQVCTKLTWRGKQFVSSMSALRLGLPDEILAEDNVGRWTQLDDFTFEFNAFEPMEVDMSHLLMSLYELGGATEYTDVVHTLSTMVTDPEAEVQRLIRAGLIQTDDATLQLTTDGIAFVEAHMTPNGHAEPAVLAERATELLFALIDIEKQYDALKGNGELQRVLGYNLTLDDDESPVENHMESPTEKTQIILVTDPDELAFSMVMACGIDGQPIAVSGWQSVFESVLRHLGRERLHEHGAALGLIIGRAIFASGHYMEDLDVTVSRQSTSKVWRRIERIARTVGITIEVALRWDNDERASYPDQQGFIVATPDGRLMTLEN